MVKDMNDIKEAISRKEKEVNKRLYNKERFVESFEINAVLLKSDRYDYIAKYIKENLELVDLDGEYTYSLKFDISDDKVVKCREFWDSELKCWNWDNFTIVGSIPKILSVEQVAKIKGCTISYVRRLCREGKLKGEKVGKDWLICAESI